jgi:hypothetical protein
MSAKRKKAKTKKPQLKVRDMNPKKNAVGGLKLDYKEQRADKI